MKSVFGILYICGLILYVECEFFKFEDNNNKTCILLKIDASFNLTYRDGNDTQKADLFDLDGAEVVEDSSECGVTFNPILMVRLFPSREKLKFTFEKAKNGRIYMRVDLYVEPAKHLKNMNDTSPFEMTDSSDLLVGYVSKSNHSYRCQATEQLFFTRNAPFAMTMNISNLHVQAYNIADDDFGPVIECDQDIMTTQPTLTTSVTEPSNESTTETPATSTIEPVPETSTFVPDNMTTIFPETTTEPAVTTTTEHTPESTTEPHTETVVTSLPTTSGPRPDVPKYTVRKGDSVCIVLQGDFSFEIKYQKKDTTIATAKVEVPYNAVVNGTCRLNNSDTEQEINLQFNQASWSLGIIVAKENSMAKVVSRQTNSAGSAYSWKRVKLSYMVDGHFEDAKDEGKNITIETDIDTYKADIMGSYKCRVEQSLNIGKENDVKMVFSKMQYRAFGTTASSNFPSNDVTECDADDKKDKGVDNKTLTIVLVCVFGGLAIIILVVGVIWYQRKRRRHSYDHLK